MSDSVLLPNAKIFLQYFEEEVVLGQGAFGHVVLAQRIVNGDDCVFNGRG